MSDNLEDLAKKIETIRDVSDFCVMWPEIKTLFDREELKDLPIESELIDLIGWLYELADRVCPGSRI